MMRPYLPILAILIAALNPAIAQDSKTGSDPVVIGLMPKLIGIDYFNAVQKGAKEAADELKVTFFYDGPTQGDSSKQAEMLDTWIARKMNVIAVSPNDANSIAPTLKKASKRGAKVITFDADAAPDSRLYFVNQASNESIGSGLVDIIAEQIGGAGEVAIITHSLTASNQNTWMEFMRKRIAEKYKGMKIIDVRPSEDPETASRAVQDLLKSNPNLKGIFAITSIALPAAARAIKEAGKSGKVALTGLATPSAMKEFVMDGTVKEFLLWNPTDLGYLTIHVAKAVNDNPKLGDKFKAGRLGDVQVSGTEVLLGPPMRFNKENVAKFDF